jgi:hypothetical protein
MQHQAAPLGIYRYGGSAVRVMQGWVETVLPDGTTIHAKPNHDSEDVARARALGYGGDVWRMTLDHDHMHVRLCHALGLRESPALRQASRGESSELAGVEEEMVLAAQRFVNLCRRDGLL